MRAHCLYKGSTFFYYGLLSFMRASVLTERAGCASQPKTFLHCAILSHHLAPTHPPFSPRGTDLLTGLRTQFFDTVSKFQVVLVRAVFGWAVLVGPATFLLYLALLPVMRRAVQRTGRLA